MIANQYINTSYTDWVVQQSIFLEWHDGPLSGFCSLKNSMFEFYFDMISNRESEDNLDDRLFRVYPVKIGTMEVLLENLSILGKPQGSTWIPIWTHQDKSRLDDLDVAIKKLINGATSSNLVIMSNNFESFTGCWEIKDSFESIDNWFTYLDIK